MSSANRWEIREEDICCRSYEIWEKEGRPHGRDLDHWFRAKQELRRELLRSACHYKRTPRTITIAVLPGVAEMTERRAA